MVKQQNTIKLNLFITDLTEYNAGNLVGKWFDALTEFDAMSAYIDDIVGKRHEWFISDSESDLFEVSEFHSIDEIKEKARKIRYINETELNSDIIKKLKDLNDDADEVYSACRNILTIDMNWYGDDSEIALGFWYFETSIKPELKNKNVHDSIIYEISTLFNAAYKGRDLILNGDFVYIGQQKNKLIYTQRQKNKLIYTQI
ncbi:antirestriction protein ArdA [Staphylococcus pseudintermedius]|nr:antirestriction protein ArdA [Staphylococcus pseudintermedius]